jgi:hypothetical protein
MSWISYLLHLRTLLTPIQLSSRSRVLRLWGVLADLPLRFSVDEAATATVRLCRASSSHTSGAITTKTSTKTEGDGGQEEARHGCPGETHEVTADVGFVTSRAECVATFDDPGTA